MILKGYSALWCANRAVLWLNGKSQRVSDGTIRHRRIQELKLGGKVERRRRQRG